jgi:hypothetical protein
MEYINDIRFPKVQKEDLIVFAARNSPEKHPELFEILKQKLPQYQYVNCMEQGLNKQQYHEVLAKSKMVISFADLETLGICQHESLLAGSIPFVPNHLCYTEEYPLTTPFLYDPINLKGLTDSFLADVCYMMDHFECYSDHIVYATQHQQENYFSCDILIDCLKRNV